MQSQTAGSNDLKQAWIALAGVALLFAWALFRSTRWPSTAPSSEVASVTPDTERVSERAPPKREVRRST